MALTDPQNTLAYHNSRVLTSHRNMRHVHCAKVAAALFKTPGEVHRASATVKVAKFNVLLTRAEGIVKLLVHDDRKPGQNESKDFRVRPAPFVRGGSCRG